MFGFSGIEFFVLMLVAVMVIGPKELPGIIRATKRTIQKIKAGAQEFSQAIMEDEELSDLKKEAYKLNEDIQQIVDLDGNLQDTYSLDDVMPAIKRKTTARKQTNDSKNRS